MFVKLRTVRTAAARTAAGLIAMAVAGMPVQAELVLEDEINAAAAQQAAAVESARTGERESTRDVIRTAEKQSITRAAEAAPMQSVPPQTQIVIQQPTPVAQPVYAAAAPMMAPATEPAAIAVEVQNLSKAELLRRQRVREELRNEDTLQERLEQLRLRDEQRRTELLVGGAPVAPVMTGAAALTDQPILAPITERPGQAATDTLAVSQSSVSSAPLAAPVGVTATEVPVTDELGPEPSIVTIMPRAGMANMKDTATYTVNSRYSAGLGLGVEVSKNLSFEMGYQFTEFGVIPAANSYFVQTVVMYQTQGLGMQNFETIAMKQNVVDAGLKLHFLGRGARLRPYVGGGAGYSKSFINLDQRVQSGSQQILGTSLTASDYRLSQMLGYLSTGFDVQLSRSIAVGMLLKYSTIFSSRENQQLSQAAFLTPGAYYTGYGVTTLENLQNQQFGASVARSSFYLISGGVTFSF